MALIQSIHIQNFRSIVNETIELNNFNCFVGKNDTGKSNVLKALNLFFNDKTDYDVKFDFVNDYSKYAKTGAHQAKEIIISVDINIPESFKEHGVKTWTKVWREDGIHSDNKNELFSGRTKALTFLSRIQYLYIPAVKSSEYFKYLLSQVYGSMTKTADSTLRTLNKEYSKQLQSLTEGLTSDLHSVLGIKSSIQMPEDLNVLFRDLTFSTEDSFIKGIDLNHRGDGIKARHIPSILRYMQNNEEKYRAKRAIVSSYIWGYEEPENGIEFLSCFDMADELYSYSTQAQLVITTHSPAFYSLKKKNATKCFYVYPTDKGNSCYRIADDESDIDMKMGLMPMIAPYIEKERNKYLENEQKLRGKLKEIELNLKKMSDRIVVITEGKTDTKHLQTAFKHMPLEEEIINRIEYYDFKNKDTLGDELSNLLEKLSRLNHTSTIIGIFDRDKTIYEKDGNPYVYLGNNVYATNIPFLENSERSKEDKICIEHYYTNAEIEKETKNGHIYMGKDFDEYGRSSDGNWCFQNREKNQNFTPLSIIDGSCKHLQRQTGQAKVATKEDFAEYVQQNPSEFEFGNFKRIYELIKQISHITVS